MVNGSGGGNRVPSDLWSGVGPASRLTFPSSEFILHSPVFFGDTGTPDESSSFFPPLLGAQARLR